MTRVLLVDLLFALATASPQEVWQAAVPTTINVDYDVPAMGPTSVGHPSGALQAQSPTRGRAHKREEVQNLDPSVGFLAKTKGRRTMRSDESLPVVNMKLVPPEVAQPEVNAEVDVLEHGREAQEKALQQTLTEVYKAALADARARINAMVSSGASSLVATEHLQQKCRGLGRGVSLLQAHSSSGDDDFSVRVSLVAPRSPDSSIQTSIDGIEEKRSAIEENLFKQACEEMSVLTTFVLQELASDLAAKKHSRVALLQEKAQDLPSQVNVRLQSAADAFPRVADLIEAMEVRRDSAESQERKRILEMELKLIDAENEMIEEALRK